MFLSYNEFDDDLLVDFMIRTKIKKIQSKNILFVSCFFVKLIIKYYYLTNNHIKKFNNFIKCILFFNLIYIYSIINIFY